MSYEFQGFMQQGWQCPICRRVYSPFTSMCLYCGKGEISTSTSTNIETVSNKNNKDDKDRFKDPFSDVIANAIGQMSRKAEDILKGNNHDE